MASIVILGFVLAKYESCGIFIATASAPSIETSQTGLWISVHKHSSGQAMQLENRARYPIGDGGQEVIGWHVLGGSHHTVGDQCLFAMQKV